MTNQQKKKIVNLRTLGQGYKTIAQQLGISENTVSSFCRRNNIYANGCKNCGQIMSKSKGTRQKLFCCDKCRNAWWNAHPEEVNRKANYELVCRSCGKTFISYGNTNRKYCSRDCYISDRFGKGERT